LHIVNVNKNLHKILSDKIVPVFAQHTMLCCSRRNIKHFKYKDPDVEEPQTFLQTDHFMFMCATDLLQYLRGAFIIC